MKRATALFLLLAMVLTVCGCNGKQSGGDHPSGNNGNQSTIMTVATDLANEFDNMPLYGEVILSVSSGASTTSANRAAVNGSPTVPKKDLLTSRANPAGVVLLSEESDFSGDGVYYHEDYVSDPFDPQYIYNHHSLKYASIDSFINTLKKMKNQALLTCKVLGKWVERNPATEVPVHPGLQPSHDNFRYRMTYDANRDFVTVEECCTEWATVTDYTKITVGHAPDGKLMIDGYIVTFDGDGIHTVKSIHYMEEAYYMAVDQDRGNGSDELTFLNYETKEWVTLSLSYDWISDQEDNLTEVFNGVDYLYACITEEHLIEISPSTVTVYLPDGRSSGTWEENGVFDFILSLDIFDGWHHAESKNENTIVTLTTETNSFDFYFAEPYPDPDFVRREFFNFHVYYSTATYPQIQLQRSYELKNNGIFWTEEEARGYIGEIASDLGLTVNEKELAFLFDAIRSRDERVNGFSFLNGITGCEMDIDTYNALMEMLKYDELTFEELNAIKNAEILAFDAQSPDYEYFEFLDFTVSGKASFDADAVEIDLSPITATLAPSILLNDGETYQLVFLLVSTDSRSMVGTVSALYNGEDTVFAGDVRLKRDNFPLEYGEYTLQFYLADALGNRISTIETVEASTTATLDLSTESRGVTLSLCPDKITIYNYVL